ncbi:MAG: GNAT family N-acetyltransferase [Nitrosomonas sp.]|nr:GNAT family N-acetyltransferase [Nitrosomonas sp.]
MADLLVKLYDLQFTDIYPDNLKENGIEIRRSLVPEKLLVSAWVNKTFGAAWASECEVSFAQQPVSCFVAIKSGQLLGFSCYNATFKGFLGPIGVEPKYRFIGIGKVLLLSCLKAMAYQGYAYAIIGSIGAKDFFDQSITTFEIPDSSPGAYKGILKYHD